MSDAETCRDAIERFLDRSWMMERTPLTTLNGHRTALNALDVWLQRHRAVALISASASDVRALFESRHWDALTRQFEALLGLVTRFYESLQECKFRSDDPIETMINQQLSLAASTLNAARPARDAKPRRGFHFSGSPVL